METVFYIRSEHFLGRIPQPFPPKRVIVASSLRSALATVASQAKVWPTKTCYLRGSDSYLSGEDTRLERQTYLLSDTFTNLSMLFATNEEEPFGLTCLEVGALAPVSLSNYAEAFYSWDHSLLQRVEKTELTDDYPQTALLLEEKPGRLIYQEFYGKKNRLRPSNHFVSGFGVGAAILGGKIGAKKKIKLRAIDDIVWNLDGIDALVENLSLELSKSELQVFILCPLLGVSIILKERITHRFGCQDFVLPDALWGYAPGLSIMEFLLAEKPHTLLLDFSCFPRIVVASCERLLS